MNWKLSGMYLARVFEFRDFIEAIKFINEIVPLAEAMNHHPDIELFSYKKVKIKLTSHEEGNKVTEKDIELAERINEIKFLS